MSYMRLQEAKGLKAGARGGLYVMGSGCAQAGLWLEWVPQAVAQGSVSS